MRGGNYYALTFGANWKPRKCMTVRPEIRWDWSDVDSPAFGMGGLYDDFGDNDQFLLATDVIIEF